MCRRVSNRRKAGERGERERERDGQKGKGQEEASSNRDQAKSLETGIRRGANKEKTERDRATDRERDDKKDISVLFLGQHGLHPLSRILQLRHRVRRLTLALLFQLLDFLQQILWGGIA